MIHRDIKTLPKLGNEVIYIDELTMEELSGVVAKVEYLDKDTALAFIVSPYKEKNDKEEPGVNGTPGFKYKDIICFDNLPNTIHGWNRDTVIGEYGKYIDESKEEN